MIYYILIHELIVYFYNLVKIKFHLRDHSTIPIPLQLKHLQVRDAHVVAGLYLLPNNNLLKEQCGIRNVSIALNVIVHLIQCLLVMVPIVKFIAEPVTVNSLDQKDLDMVMPQHWFQQMESQQFNCMYFKRTILNYNLF